MSERPTHHIKAVQAAQFIPEDEFIENPDTIPHTYHPDAAWHCPNCGWNAQIVQVSGGKIGGRWYTCRHCGWRNHTSMPGLGGVARLYLMPADDGNVCAADDDPRQKIPIRLRDCGTQRERDFAKASFSRDAS